MMESESRVDFETSVHKETWGCIEHAPTTACIDIIRKGNALNMQICVPKTNSYEDAELAMHVLMTDAVVDVEPVSSESAFVRLGAELI